MEKQITKLKPKKNGDMTWYDTIRYDTIWYDTIWYDMIRTFMYTFIMIGISLCILWYILIYYTHIKPLRTYYIIANIFRRVDLNIVDIGCRGKGSTLCHATRGPGDPVFDMENHQVVARIVVDFPMICGENPSKSGKRIQFCRSTSHVFPVKTKCVQVKKTCLLVEASSWHPIVVHLNLLNLLHQLPTLSGYSSIFAKFVLMKSILFEDPTFGEKIWSDFSTPLELLFLKIHGFHHHLGVSENSVPHCTQWFCWSSSLWKMAISLGILTQHFQTNPFWSFFSVNHLCSWAKMRWGPQLRVLPGPQGALAVLPGAVAYPWLGWLGVRGFGRLNG